MGKAVASMVGMCVVLFVVVMGCTMEAPQSSEEGVLNLVFSRGGLFQVQTIEPDLDMDIATYDVLGTGPGGASFEQLDITSTTVVQASLVPGQWSITVNARNAGGVIIGSGSVVVEVVAGEVTTATVTVVPLSGEGTLDVTVVWPSGVLTTPSVNGSLTPVGGTAQPVSFVLAVDELSANYTESLQNGYYTLTTRLDDDAEMAWGTVEAVRIIAGELSSKVYTLVQDVNRGGLELEITPDIQNPIEISFNVSASIQIVLGEDVTVIATTSEAVDSYQWYLQGIPLAGETSDTITIGSGLETGTYWLDLIVSKGIVLGSGRVAISVVKKTCNRAGVVHPILEKVIDNGDCTYTAHFGYKNDSDEPVIIPYGPDNRFHPNPEFRGQPMLFKPGRTTYYPDSWFTVDFKGRYLVWILNGRTATASRCSPYILRRPFICITRPSEGSTYNSWNDVIVKAKAWDRDGYATKVEFYDGTSMIGVDTTAPYFVRLRELFVGTHFLTAIAYDDDHMTRISKTVTIVVR
jgi:hypothetical protein